MATSKEQMSLNVDDEEDELQFKDSFPGFSDAPILNDEEHAKLLPSYDDEKPEKVSFWEFKYYQNLFNVDTRQVTERIIWSAIPRPGEATYLHRLIRPNPDLYGPFWICITLIFTIAVSNNIAEYLESLGTEKAVFDYRKVTFTATTLFSYTFLLPLVVWGFLWRFESTAQLTIFEIICIYGYSLAIYIPISILWIVKIFWLQLILIFVGFLLSTSVMMLTFWPTVRETRTKISAVVLVVICFFHALLCFGFSVYFFQPQHLAANAAVTIKVPDSSHLAKSANPVAVTQIPETSNMFLKSNDSLKHSVEKSSHSISVEEKHPFVTSKGDSDKVNPSLPLVTKNDSKTGKVKRKASILTQPNDSKSQQILLDKNNVNLQDIQS